MTYAEIQTAVANYLNRTDLTSEIQTFINVGLRKIERKREFHHMRVRYNLSVVLNDYLLSNPIPNYKRFISAFIKTVDDYSYPMREASHEEAMRCYPSVLYDTGRPELITVLPATETTLTPDVSPTDKILIRPTADDTYTIDLYAYQYSPALDGVTYTTNWWTANHPEVVIYAAMEEAEAFMLNDAQVAKWAAMKDEAVKMIHDSEVKEELGKMPRAIRSIYVV